MSSRADPQTKGHGVLFLWLLVASVGLGMLALGSGPFSAIGASPGQDGRGARPDGVPASVAAQGPPGAAARMAESSRTPIRVLTERRAHPTCSSAGRVPIAVMIACRQVGVGLSARPGG